jgi:hypothetical protein
MNKRTAHPTQEELLTRQVDAINKLSGYSKRLQNQLLELLKPYQGKKIVKSSGSYPELMAKITRPEPEEDFRYWLRISEYRIDVEVDTTYKTREHEGGGYSVNYVKQSFHLCTISDGTDLKELTDGKYLQGRREDFTAREIQEKRQKISELEKHISAIRSGIYPFDSQR